MKWQADTWERKCHAVNLLRAIGVFALALTILSAVLDVRSWMGSDFMELSNLAALVLLIIFQLGTILRFKWAAIGLSLGCLVISVVLVAGMVSMDSARSLGFVLTMGPVAGLCLCPAWLTIRGWGALR